MAGEYFRAGFECMMIAAELRNSPMTRDLETEAQLKREIEERATSLDKFKNFFKKAGQGIKKGAQVMYQTSKKVLDFGIKSGIVQGICSQLGPKGEAIGALLGGLNAAVNPEKEPEPDPSANTPEPQPPKSKEDMIKDFVQEWLGKRQEYHKENPNLAFETIDNEIYKVFVDVGKMDGFTPEDAAEIRRRYDQYTHPVADNYKPTTARDMKERVGWHATVGGGIQGVGDVLFSISHRDAEQQRIDKERTAWYGAFAGGIDGLGDLAIAVKGRETEERGPNWNTPPSKTQLDPYASPYKPKKPINAGFKPDDNKGPYVYQVQKPAPVYQPVPFDTTSLTKQFTTTNQAFADKFSSWT
jgi:hypothetical protein